MRYLQGRNQFLNTKIQLKSSNFNQDFKNSKLIKEASAGMGGWENDITWGGSLIGRLINSTIRRTGIYVKTAKIPFLLRQLENELLSLVAEASLSEEDQKKLIVTQFKFLIMKVYNIVVSGDSVDKKLTQLIGDGKTDDQGTLNETIKLVEKIEPEILEDKEELLTKLKGFRDALKEEDFEPEEFTGEDEEGEEQGQGGGQGQGGKGEGQGKDSDSSKSGNPEFDFYTNTSNLFKALIDLNNVIQNKRVQLGDSTTPTQQPNKSKIEVGKEYLHTSKQGVKNTVKVVSLTHKMKIGGDKKWITADDSEVEKLKPEIVFVIFKDKNGQYSSASPQMSVYTSQLSDLKADSFKESHFYLNESLPIFENVANIGKNEVNAKAAWSKVMVASKNSKLSDHSKLMKQVIDESKEGETLNKKVIIALGKQIIMNESNEGKPISFEALIKEEIGAVSSKYNVIPKTVSLMARILLSFKDDLGLLSQLGEAANPIKKFISAYDEMKKNYENLPKKSEQSKKQETNKEGEKEKNLKKMESLRDFYSFKMRIFEADEEGDIEDQEEGDIKDSDFVEEAWYEFFEEGEEEAWVVSQEEGMKLQKGAEKSTKNPFAIKDRDYDKVVRIVNIFGKAYKCYATDVIPSGRPGGKTSLKTFREYKYIGSEERTPNWSADASAGFGPWAAKLPFTQWEDGVMKILEKPELREVLANARFLPKGVKPLGSGVTGKSSRFGSDETAEFEKAVRAGRSLFDFMNDLLAGEGEFSDYRKRIMKEYFSGADKVDDKELKNIENESSKLKPSPDEVSSPSEVGFFALERFGKGRNINIDEFKKEKSFYRTFFRIRYKDGGNFYYMIGQFLYSIGDKIVVKFQKPDKRNQQSIVSRYLADDIQKNNWKLSEIDYKEGLELFIGVLELNSLVNGKNAIVRSVDLKRNGSYESSDIKSNKIEILEVEILGKNNQEKELTTIKKIKRDKSLPYDIDSEKIKVDDFKEKKK